jgi:hypothetical protein
MAEQRTYTSRVSANPGPTDSITYRRGLNGATSTIGRGLQNLGQGLGAVAGALQDRERQVRTDQEAREKELAKRRAEEARLNAANTSVLAKTELVERIFQEEMNMPPGGVYEDGKEYSERVREISDEVVKKYSEQSTYDEATILKAELLPFTEKTYLEGLATQAKAQYSHTLEQNIEGATLDLNLAMKRPEMIYELWESRKNLIQGTSKIGAVNQKAILDKIGPAYAIMPLQIDMNRAKEGKMSAGTIINAIDSGEYESQAKAMGLTIPTKELMEMREKAVSLNNAQRTVNQYAINNTMKDVLADARITGNMPPDSVFAELSSQGATDNQLQALQNEVRLVVQTKAYRDELMYDPKKFITKTLPQLEKGALTSGKGSNERQEVYAEMAQLAQSRWKEVHENPGEASTAWLANISMSANGDVEQVIRKSGQVSSAWEQPGVKVKLDENGELGPYPSAQLRLAWQESQGIDSSRQEILGKSVAKQLVSEITRGEDLITPGNVNSVIEKTKALKQQYGDLFPIVQRELIASGLPMQYGVLDWAEGTLYENKIIESIQNSITAAEERAGLNGVAKSSLKQNVQTATKPYTDAVAATAPGGRSDAFTKSLNDTLYAVVVNLMNEPGERRDSLEIANTVAKELIYDRYHLPRGQEKNLIPKRGPDGTVYDADKIYKNLSAIRGNLKSSDLSFQMSPKNLPADIQQANYVDFIKNNAYWVTSPDQQGAYLAVDIYPYAAQPVYHATGKKIEWKYDTLNNKNYIVSPVKAKTLPSGRVGN